MPTSEDQFNAARRRMGMVRQEPALRPAYAYRRKPTVIEAPPTGLNWTVELWEGGKLARVLARAENVALARGAFDRAAKMWPDEDLRLCCGDNVVVRIG